MTGHWPLETAPLVADIDGDGHEEIVAVNRGGQLLLWKADGSAIGPGEDGLVVQLPEGKWTTTPTSVATTGPGNVRLLVASVEGQMVGLDAQCQIVWKLKLPGTTTWGRAIPAELHTNGSSAYLLCDESGSETLLDPNRTFLWQKNLNTGPCRAPPQSFTPQPDATAFLVPAGSTLHALTGTRTLWKRDLSGEIHSRPEVLRLQNKTLVICGAGNGFLYALQADTGEVAWKTELGDEIDSSIVFWPSADQAKLILCTGLWGNLHALDLDGHRVWTHLYRSKSRARPLLFDLDGDGQPEIILSTHRQHILAFDANGAQVDDVRVNGLAAPGPVALHDATGKPNGILVATASLLAYRLRPAPPHWPYPHAEKAADVKVERVSMDETGRPPAVLVRNPHGALLHASVSVTHGQDYRLIDGTLTARSAFEVTVPPDGKPDSATVHVSIRDAAGHVVLEKDWRPPGQPTASTATHASALLRAWPTDPYGDFDAVRLQPFRRETPGDGANAVTVPALYQGEVDEAAFIIASAHDKPVHVRVESAPPVRSDGKTFAGVITLRQVIATPTLNGEWAADALPSLGESGLVTIPPHRAAKIWISVDAQRAEAGTYHGAIRLVPLEIDGPAPLELRIEVLDLRLPQRPPLRLCTWDYVPNRWFPLSAAGAALDDMNRHGVNIFPRSGAPEGQVDAAGQVAMDWTAFDAELERLKGRGIILYHLGHPSLKFPPGFAEEKKRAAELAYLHTFRDHLHARGRSYEDYAFYPVDEPGLDYGKSVSELIDAATLLREADPRFRIYTDPVPTISWKDFERIEPLIDVWCPNMRLVSGLLASDPRIARIVKSGNPVWSYECVGQVKSLSPLRYNRANAWRGKYFGLSGIGFWTHSQTQADLWKPDPKLKDEYALVYPGQVPVPSVRWEAARDGLEDVAAIALLEQRIKSCRDQGVTADLVREAEMILRIAQTDMMELSDDAFIESRDFLREGDRRIWHTRTDLALIHLHRAEIARMTLALGAVSG